MFLCLVLATAHVSLHRSACSRGYKLVKRGMDPRSLWVGVFICLSVCILYCHCWALFLCFLSLHVKGPSPFIVCKGRGRVTVFGCMKIERKGPKVLPIASLPLCSCIRTITMVVVACYAVDDAAKPYPNTVSWWRRFHGPKVSLVKRCRAWMAVASRPVEVDMVGCGVT
jgi:hypothetical protein